MARKLLAAVGAAASLTIIASATPAAAAPPLPPRRVADLTPRVVDLTPRVRDVAPEHRKNTYTVDADVLFAFDSAKLSAAAKNVLAEVVQTLEERPASSSVTVAGYTDSVGKKAYNRRLSQRRAEAVTSYLRERAGKLDYNAVGHGEANPVAPNKKNGHDNPAGRQKNRRVTIHYSG